MIYEIVVSPYMKGTKKSIGHYFFEKENAEKECKSLNALMNIYSVREVEMRDEKKCENCGNAE